jgi:enoyl-CoA hydratase
MTYKTLIIEIADTVALIRLNRPDALNALNAALMAELAQAMAAIDANGDVRCIVLTGSDKAFAAGADVREMAEKTFADVFTDDLFGPDIDAISRIRKPIIAAVSGFALGGGCELAMMCDFIIASDTAKFGQPEINLGIVAGMGGTQRLTRLVGKSKSMEMHLTGRFMVPVGDLIDEAMKTARKIAQKSTLAVMAVKEAVTRAQEGSLREGLLFERRLFHALFATEDQKEGMAAFLEKRQPKFRDK